MERGGGPESKEKKLHAPAKTKNTKESQALWCEV